MVVFVLPTWLMRVWQHFPTTSGEDPAPLGIPGHAQVYPNASASHSGSFHEHDSNLSPSRTSGRDCLPSREDRDRARPRWLRQRRNHLPKPAKTCEFFPKDRGQLAVRRLRGRPDVPGCRVGRDQLESSRVQTTGEVLVAGDRRGRLRCVEFGDELGMDVALAGRVALGHAANGIRRGGWSVGSSAQARDRASRSTASGDNLRELRVKGGLAHQHVVGGRA